MARASGRSPIRRRRSVAPAPRRAPVPAARRRRPSRPPKPGGTRYGRYGTVGPSPNPHCAVGGDIGVKAGGIKTLRRAATPCHTPPWGPPALSLIVAVDVARQHLAL